MSGKHGISWLNRPGYIGETWNPVVGCEVVSPGCTNCYAMRMAHRIQAMDPASHYHGTTQAVNGQPVWTGKVAKASEKTLLAPLRWRKPRMVFVNSMGDLFHPAVPDFWRDQVCTVMAISNTIRAESGLPLHIFTLLTKRPDVMQEYFDSASVDRRSFITFTAAQIADAGDVQDFDWPLPNLWLGVSAEDQRRAKERIPALLDTPAAVRFVSVEPQLGPVTLRTLNVAGPIWKEYDALSGVCYFGSRHGRMKGKTFQHPPSLDWVICGGESGPGRRPFDPQWARDMRAQCDDAGVPFFFKQHGHRRADDGLLDGETVHAWPEGWV